MENKMRNKIFTSLSYIILSFIFLGCEDRGHSLVEEAAVTGACPDGSGGATLSRGIENGQFSRFQTFDAQRTPAYPDAGQSFTVSSFDHPYADPGGQYTMLDGEYITFFYAGGDITQNAKTGCNVGIKLHTSSGETVIASGGTIWGISEVGFLHNSSPGDYGTFIAANLGMQIGAGTTYTPVGDIASCADLVDYIVSNTPLEDGEAAESCD